MADNIAPSGNGKTYTDIASSEKSYYCKIRMGKYRRPQPFDTASFVTEFEAILPLPNELREDTRAEFNTPSLETIGDIINTSASVKGAAQGLGGIVGGLALRKFGNVVSGLAGAGAGAAAQKATGSESAGDAAQEATQQILDPAAITSALQQSIGAAPNPNQTVAFQGPALRDHNFSWTFFPQSEEESIRIKNMINELKMRSLPTSTMSTHAGILNYPQMAVINFFPWDSGTPYPSGNPYGWTTKSIIRIKKCFVASVNVNYSPTGTSAFFHDDESRPVAIQLSINLKEIEYMMGEDYGAASGWAAAPGGQLDSIASWFKWGSNIRDQITEADQGVTDASVGTPAQAGDVQTAVKEGTQ